jgi:hypothetical protein
MRQKFVIVFAVLALLGVLFHQKNPLTRAAQSYSQEVALVAGGTYVSLRSVNALLSTAQDIQLGADALVASANVQPLKVLEPIDDIIERVAQAVFILMVSAGVMGVGFGPISVLGCVFLGVSAILLSLRNATQETQKFAMHLGVYGVLCALVLPVTFVCSMVLGEVLTHEAWAYHGQVLDSVIAQDPAKAVVSSSEDSGWFGGLSEAKDQMAQYYEAAQVIALRADELVLSLIALGSIYIFKMMVLPGIVLLGAVVLMRNFPVQELALYLTRKQAQDADKHEQEQA